jgi:hypothetical protein
MAEEISDFAVAATLLGTLLNTIDGDLPASCEQGGDVRPTTSLTNGTGANQANRAWQDRARTLLSGATENLDLFDLGAIDIGAGAGKSALGQAINLAKVVGLLIHVDPASAGTLKIGGEGSGAAWNSVVDGNDTAKLSGFGADSFLFLFCPTLAAWDVADATNHLLKFEAVGGNVTYSVYLVGRTAP